MPSSPRQSISGDPSLRSSSRRTGPTASIAVLAGLCAALAPVTLTGDPAVDAVERGLVVASTSFVAAHARRWTWLVAGGLIAVSARGVSLVWVCAGLAVAVAAARPRRRPKELGAASVGLVLNGLFWYPASTPAPVPHLIGVLTIAFVLWSGYPQMRRRPRRTTAAVLAATAAFVVVAFGLAGWVALSSQGDIEAGTASARTALAAVRRGDSERARSALADAQGHLRAADGRLQDLTLDPIGAIPVAAQQARAVKVSVQTARSVTDAAEALLATDYDDLRYAGQIDVDRISTLQPESEEVLSVLSQARLDLTDVRTLPLVSPLRTRVDDFADQVADAERDADLAAELLDVAPDLLGGGEVRHYLVVFQTPAELRGAGGFVGNWVELEADDGDVRLSRSGRIEELIEAAAPGVRTISGPADYVARYDRYHPADNLQDTTISPNWPSNGAVLAELYPQSGGRPVDGVFAVDPTGLAALLELTGPITVPGLDASLSADNAVQFLTRDQYLQFPERDLRAQVLEDAIRITFERLTEASLPAPRRLGDVLGPAVRARHFQLWSPDGDEQQLFERLDADGRVAIPKGQDGLAVIQQNAGNNKIDAYLRRQVSYRATVDASDATISATVRVTLRNEVPSLDLGAAVVDNARGLPIGTNLTSLSLYTPHTVRSATIDGREVVLVPDRELGLLVWDTALLSIPPGGAVTVEFELDGTLDLSEAYTFRYLPQPLADAERLNADIRVTSGRFEAPTDSAGVSLRGDVDEAVVLRSEVRPDG